MVHNKQARMSTRAVTSTEGTKFTCNLFTDSIRHMYYADAPGPVCPGIHKRCAPYGARDAYCELEPRETSLAALEGKSVETRPTAHEENFLVVLRAFDIARGRLPVNIVDAVLQDKAWEPAVVEKRVRAQSKDEHAQSMSICSGYGIHHLIAGVSCQENCSGPSNAL